MGKVIGRVYKQIQNNRPHQSYNKTFVVLPCFFSSQQNDSISGCVVYVISIISTYPASNLTTTNKVDTDINNDDESQSFQNPRKINHSGMELRDDSTPNTQV